MRIKKREYIYIYIYIYKDRWHQTRDLLATYAAQEWQGCQDDLNVTTEACFWLLNNVACVA